MQRDVIVDVGKTGFGKTLWTRIFLKQFHRVLVYDPLQAIETNYVTDAEIDEMLTEERYLDVEQKEHFTYGTINKDMLPAFGDLAYVLSNVLLVVEECATVFDKGMRNLPEWAKRLVFQGRHRSVSLLLIAQRPISIPIDIRTQANRIVTFQQHEGDDLDWLIGFFGKENCKQMPFLPKFECLDYWNGQVNRYSIKKQAEALLGKKLTIEQHDFVFV